MTMPHLGIDQLRSNLIRPRDAENGPCVLMASAVVGGREDCDQISSREPFEPVHHALMRSDDFGKVVGLEELFDDVWPELDDVSGVVRVADGVVLDSQFVVVVGGVRPENVYDKFFEIGGDFVNDFERTGDL